MVPGAFRPVDAQRNVHATRLALGDLGEQLPQPEALRSVQNALGVGIRWVAVGKIAGLSYRPDVLNTFVKPRLMNAKQAGKAFARVQKATKSKLPVPMNKQKGDKKRPAYLTAMVNMLIDANIRGLPCDYDPRELTTFTHMGAPLRTLARRIDGAFPSAVNPIAVWEIKEYYYTTTFGSRVADGVYETLLDGMELDELRQSEKVACQHYLMIDARYTWWDCGRSYLCRIVDMLHMGYVDEVLVGTEVLERLPKLAKEWAVLLKARAANRK